MSPRAGRGRPPHRDFDAGGIHTHDDGTEEWMTFFADGEGNTLALMSRDG
jgi:hypothetical protein